MFRCGHMGDAVWFVSWALRDEYQEVGARHSLVVLSRTNAQHAHLCSIANRRLTQHAYIGQRCLFSTLPRPSYHGRLALQPHDNIISAVAMDDRHPTMPLLLPKARGDLFALMECGSYTIRDQLKRVRPNGPQNLNRPTPPTK